ncbi:LysR family transcriptional regulator [Polyangium jinanense]|uniref:LysR family transcriptional regulator n=1 Tax=Polyangium jinanense TaxID=2829994 RepID=A0A9X3WZ73_9BACT|nr:LysR family transcriptional regulator [Polyangium jinanense]MDC3955145.1 LysR family transcriptional regulator [Polyangium jinanense]MDC3981087.1 LysR family transcriptional regulator [Polyangium jinanense]
MEGLELAHLDLNLLVIFDLLMTERSVTLAARRLGRAQSAVSYSLARLRETFEDPLFVRTKAGLAPTPRAEALHREVREVLSRLREVVQGQVRFDPARARRTFTVAMTDYVELVLLPVLAQRLAQVAPGVDLEVTASGDDIERQLEEGAVDLAVGVMFYERPGVYTRKLFGESFVCLARAGHPALTERETLSPETFAGLLHVLVAPRGRPGSFVDSALERMGLSRRVALRVQHYLAAPRVVAETDMVLTSPTRLARAHAAGLAVRAFPPPVELPGFFVRAAWHERRQGDSGVSWLRGLLIELGEELDRAS